MSNGRSTVDKSGTKPVQTALESFNKAMKIDPEFFGNYWGAAIVLVEKKKFGIARNYLEQAVKMLPDDIGAPASEQIPELLEICNSELNDKI